MDKNIVASDAKQYILTKFDGEQYGIDIDFIDNIVRLQAITRVPHSQDYFLGVINLRGEIIPVMSFRAKFDLPDKDNTHLTRILIVKVDGAKIGILVDEVKEVVTLTEDDIEKQSMEASEVNAYITGVGKYGQTLITLLNIQALVMDIEEDVY